MGDRSAPGTNQPAWPASPWRQAFIRLSRDRLVFALLVTALGSTLGAALCALAFSRLVNSKPLPYPQHERLVVAEHSALDPAGNTASRGYSYPAIAYLQWASADILPDSAMIDHARDVIVSHPAQPLLNVSYVTDGYAGLFAPPMQLGRFPGAGESGDVSRPVAVISHAAWQMLFGRRGDVLGLQLRTATGVDFEVVGVTSPDFVEPGFFGPGHRTGVWLPWQFNPSPQHWGWAATTPNLILAGRLAPDVDIQLATERLSTLADLRWQEALGTPSGTHAGWSTRTRLVPAQTAIAGDSADVGMLLLAGTAGLVLLALVNTAHVLMARTAARAREFSIQSALGASRRHIFSLVLADSLLIMLPAGVLAIAVAAVGLALMRSHLDGLLARIDELSVGWTAVVPALGASVVLAVLLAAIVVRFSALPAANGALNAGRQRTTSAMSRRLRQLFMAIQIGVAGVLIAAGAGLFRDASALLDERGIDLERSSSAHLYQRNTGIAPGALIEQRHRMLRQQLVELPMVEGVSQSHSPLQDFIEISVATIAGSSGHPVGLKRIDHRYLALTGQQLVVGRNFSAAEIQQGAGVALVNAALARTLGTDGDVIGARLTRGDSDPFTVIGVVDELAHPGEPEDAPRIYLPASEAGSNFIIRFRPGQRMSREQLVSFIATVDPGLRVFLYDDLEQQRSEILLPRRIAATATLLIASIVMLVSALGLYGMVGYGTHLVRTEIGTRLAFGARPGHIMLMLVKNNLAAVLSGSVAAAVLLLLLLPAARQWLDGAELALHWIDMAMSLAVLVLLMLLACWLSARPLLALAPAAVLAEQRARC